MPACRSSFRWTALGRTMVRAIAVRPKEDLMKPHQPAGRRRALLVSVLALPLLAAASPGAPPPRFEETTQVVAVEVPVNVFDREGHPVRGLTAADFEVFDEGARQPISNFDVVDLDSLRPDQAPADAVERPGAVGTVADVDAVSSAVRRHFLLLFDVSFSNPTAVLRARLAARDFVLHSLRPTDLVAVATYSLASGPRLVLTFTPDRAQLPHAIGTLGFDKSEKVGQADIDPLRFVIAPPSSFAAGFDVALPPGALGAAGGSGNPKQDVRDASNAALLDALIAQRAAEERELRAYE